MLLYERLGVSLADHIALDARLKVLSTSLELDKNPYLAKGLQIDARDQVALAHYLLEDPSETERHAEALVEQVKDFLFGEWRNRYTTTHGVMDATSPLGTRPLTVTYDAAECRRRLTWMRGFRAGLLWALYLGREADVKRIASYPAEDVYDENFGGDFRPPYKSCYALLSSVLLDADRPLDQNHIDQVERGSKEKPKLLLAALRQISARDASGFDKALAKCVRHHVKCELSSGQRSLDTKLDLDGSTLAHVARTVGLSVTPGNGLRDHLVRCEV